MHGSHGTAMPRARMHACQNRPDMDTPFGRALRTLWDLDPQATFLNHGSFGACPREVLAEQARIRAQMESAPDAFFRGAIMPREDGTLSPLNDHISSPPASSFSSPRPSTVS